MQSCVSRLWTVTNSAPLAATAAVGAKDSPRREVRLALGATLWWLDSRQPHLILSPVFHFLCSNGSAYGGLVPTNHCNVVTPCEEALTLPLTHEDSRNVSCVPAFACALAASTTKYTAVPIWNSTIAARNTISTHELTTRIIEDIATENVAEVRVAAQAASTMEANISDDLDTISINVNTINDDVNMISAARLPTSALELSISDDTDMISATGLELSTSELNINDDMNMISNTRLKLSTSELNINDDMDMIRPAWVVISSNLDAISLDQPAHPLSSVFCTHLVASNSRHLHNLV